MCKDKVTKMTTALKKLNVVHSSYNPDKTGKSFNHFIIFEKVCKIDDLPTSHRPYYKTIHTGTNEWVKLTEPEFEEFWPQFNAYLRKNEKGIA